MSIKQDTTTKILKYSLWGCLYLTLFTVLLVGSKFIFPFITLKTLYFRILIEVAAVLYFLLALANSYYRPKMNKVLWFILGFGLIVLITGIFGVDSYRSFWGTIERGEGFLYISHLMVFSFILSQVFKTKQDWLNFFSASIFVSLLVGVYAFAQKTGAGWTFSNSAGDRFSSTLGNASYLGAYALGHFWLCLLLFWHKRHLAWKIIFALIGLFEIFILFQTQTRGAMVGLLITLLLYAIISIILSPYKKIKIIFAAVLILLILSSSFIWINRQEDWVNQSGPLGRLANISFQSVTVESRLLTMDTSWQAWQDRFLVGYGWENYNIAFNKYFHAEIYRDRGSQIWFDRAHNTIFDVAIASGLFGLLAYLGIYLSCFIVLLKIIRRQKYYLNFSLTIMAFLLAHFIQNIVVFDSLPTYIMLFSVFGFVAALDNKKHYEKAQQNIVLKPINVYALSVGVIAFLFVVYNFNIKPAQANMQGIQGLIGIYNGEFEAGLERYKQGIDMHTYQTPELRQKLAETMLQMNNSNYIDDPQLIKDNYDYSIDQIKLNIQSSPLNARNYLFLLTLSNAAAISFPNAGYSEQVLAYGQQALELSPTRPQMYFEMGRSAISLGQADQGLKYFEKAVALNPKTMDSHWNLLTAYIITGRLSQAEQEYRTMLNRGITENAATLERLGQIHSSIKNYASMIPISQKLIKIDPGNVDYWTKLATLYKETGDLENAKRIAQEIMRKFPENKAEAEQFLNSIE